MTVAELAAELAVTAEELAAVLRPPVRATALPSPADVYELVAELRETVTQLDAMCQNLMLHSLELARDDRLSHDRHGRGPEAALEADAAAQALRTARTGLSAVYRALDQAQTGYAPLSLREVSR